MPIKRATPHMLEVGSAGEAPATVSACDSYVRVTGHHCAPAGRGCRDSIVASKPLSDSRSACAGAARDHLRQVSRVAERRISSRRNRYTPRPLDVDEIVARDL